jgi:hypothetical protein
MYPCQDESGQLDSGLWDIWQNLDLLDVALLIPPQFIFAAPFYLLNPLHQKKKHHMAEELDSSIAPTSLPTQQW